MPAEDQAVQTAAAMTKVGVQLIVQVSELLLRAMSRLLQKQVRQMPQQPDKRTKQSLKRLRMVAQKEGTTIQQHTFDGMSADDPRFKQLESQLKKDGIAYSLDRSTDGMCCLSIKASDEQQAENAAKRIGLLFDQKVIDNVDSPSERQARDQAAGLVQGRTKEQTEAEPVFTLNVRTRPYDLRAGIIKQNLDRLGIKSVVHDTGSLTRISFRQPDAPAVKKLIDSLAQAKTLTAFDTSRIENYDELTRAATHETPVQQQDKDIIRLLSEQEAGAPAAAKAAPPKAPDTPDDPDRPDIGRFATRGADGKKHISRGAARSIIHDMTDRRTAAEAKEQTREITHEIKQEGPTR